MTAIYYETENDAKAKLMPANVTAKAMKDAVFTVTFPVKTAVTYPGSDAEKLKVELEPKGEKKGPPVEATPCARDLATRAETECQFGVRLADGIEAAGEYTVKVMVGDKPLSITPGTIKVTPEKAKNPAAKERPRRIELCPNRLGCIENRVTSQWTVWMRISGGETSSME